MISIEKIMQNLMQCRDSNLILPRLNDSDDNPYLQKTAIDLRRIELENVEEVFTQLNESNFTMDKELEELNRRLDASNLSSSVSSNVYSNVSSSANRSLSTLSNVNTIPSESLIIYVENETAPLPEVILHLLHAAEKSQDDWYIYGVKNPESFYKSFLLLTQLDFIIKNKTEKKNEVATFKREMALHYETFYKTLEYRKLRLPHHDMIHKLTSIDNYCGYDALRFICDYCQVNIILLDIIERKYLDVRYTPNKLVPDVVKKAHAPHEFIIIIKYVAETYLPLMNSSGVHIFTQKALDHICHNYERLVIDKFKEPMQDVPDKVIDNVIDNDGLRIPNANIDIDDESLDMRGALGDTNELNLSDIEEPQAEETGSFLDSKTVSVFFNNTIPRKEKNISLNPIISTGNFSMAIEDMIEISDIPPPQNTEVSIVSSIAKNDKFSKLLDTIPVSNKTPSNATSKAPSNLLDLQMLARVHKIDTQKEGKAGKRVNKTKEEMYNEIKEKLS
jgi:hypothetical protein